MARRLAQQLFFQSRCRSEALLSNSRSRIADREKILTTAALWIGDAVHNLKCALDYAWMETIERVAPVAISRFAKFPVYPTQEALEGALRGAKIHDVCQSLFRLMVDDIRPYDRRILPVGPFTFSIREINIVS